MPHIRDISLFLGRSSLSEEEVVRIAFNVDFSPEEQKLKEGFIMQILLIDVNGKLDDFRTGTNGVFMRNKIDDADHIVGEIFRDIIHPTGSTMRVDRTKAWDFGVLGEGMEEFLALIAIIPKNWEFSPALAQSGPVRIDLG